MLLKLFIFSLFVVSASAEFPSFNTFLNMFLKKSKEPPLCKSDYFSKFLPKGYPFERHEVTTEDGYILGLFRLQKKNTQIKNGLKPVFLQHGINNCALSWMLNGEKNSMAYLLAEAGFDVWLGNNRGNKFSRQHVSRNVDSEEFWDFSFQEMAEFDLPASFEYVRKINGGQKITYIGHSQGTTQMFAALSDPKTKEKLSPYLISFHAMAPVVYFKNIKVWFLKYGRLIHYQLAGLINIFKIYYLRPGNCEFDATSFKTYRNKCQHENCDYLDLTDPVNQYVNYNNYGNIVNDGDSGFSAKCIFHFGQLANQNENDFSLNKYDYGSSGNREHYGQETVPTYDLGKITDKVYLYPGTTDTIINDRDSEELQKRLTKAQVTFRPVPGWGHMSFLIPTKPFFYQSVIESIKQDLENEDKANPQPSSESKESLDESSSNTAAAQNPTFVQPGGDSQNPIQH